MIIWYEITPEPSFLETPTNSLVYGKIKIKGGNHHDFKGKEGSYHR